MPDPKKFEKKVASISKTSMYDTNSVQLQASPLEESNIIWSHALNAGAHLGFLEGRGLDFRKGVNQYKTKTKQL